MNFWWYHQCLLSKLVHFSEESVPRCLPELPESHQFCSSNPMFQPSNRKWNPIPQSSKESHLQIHCVVHIVFLQFSLGLDPRHWHELLVRHWLRNTTVLAPVRHIDQLPQVITSASFGARVEVHEKTSIHQGTNMLDFFQWFSTHALLDVRQKLIGGLRNLDQIHLPSFW